MRENETLGEPVPPVLDFIQVEECRYILDEKGQPTGYIHRVKGRELQAIFDDLKVRLEAEFEGIYWVTSGWQYEQPEIFNWPEIAHAICYPMRGSSEGYLIHVDVFYRKRNGLGPTGPWYRQPLATVKILSGKDTAWAIARRAAELLDVI